MIIIIIVIHSTSSHANINLAKISFIALILPNFIHLIIIMPAHILFSQLLNLIQHIITQINIIIRILLNFSNNILINNIKTPPTLIAPSSIVMVNRTIRMFRLNVCFKNDRRIHHFNSTKTIITTLIPVHAAIPITSIITHSKIIKRMNRQYNISINHTVIQNTRMKNTELLKCFFIQLKPIDNFSHHSHEFHITFQLKRLRSICMRATANNNRLGTPFSHIQIFIGYERFIIKAMVNHTTTISTLILIKSGIHPRIIGISNLLIRVNEFFNVC